MDTATRQYIEKTIALKFIEAALSRPFFSITVEDGEEEVLAKSTDSEAITTVMMQTDEDTLYVFQHDKQVGWAHFVYGNEGYDVIADHSNTVQLNSIIAEVEPAIEAVRKSFDV